MREVTHFYLVQGPQLDIRFRVPDNKPIDKFIQTQMIGFRVLTMYTADGLSQFVDLSVFCPDYLGLFFISTH